LSGSDIVGLLEEVDGSGCEGCEYEVEGSGCESCEEEVAVTGCEARFFALLRVGLECCMNGRVAERRVGNNTQRGQSEYTVRAVTPRRTDVSRRFHQRVARVMFPTRGLTEREQR